MSQELSEEDDGGGGEGQSEYQRRLPPLRMRQIRMDIQAQLAEAQKLTARATAKCARYMLIAAAASAVSSVVTMVAVLYGIFVLLPRVPH
jgi:hypothetical protein